MIAPVVARSPVAPGLLSVAAVGVMVAVNRFQGRVIWCACGGLAPWSFDIWSRHNSQHLIDPYSATHVLHGLAFFGLAWLVARRTPLAWRFAGTVVVEAAWEVLENGQTVIQKYREATISLDYFGDSLVNSVGDVACCALGFLVAARLPWRASVALFLATELVLVATIHDSLLINILMLIHPIEAVRQWQMGA